MSRGSFVRIDGLEDVRRVIETVAPREAKALARAVVKEGAATVAADAKENVQGQGLVDTGKLLTGLRSQSERDQGSVMRASVRVRNAFYWRFLERGDGPDGIEHAFILKAREKMLQNLDGFILRSFTKQLVRRLEKALGR